MEEKIIATAIIKADKDGYINLGHGAKMLLSGIDLSFFNRGNISAAKTEKGLEVKFPITLKANF